MDPLVQGLSEGTYRAFAELVGAVAGNAAGEDGIYVYHIYILYIIYNIIIIYIYILSYINILISKLDRMYSICVCFLRSAKIYVLFLCFIGSCFLLNHASPTLDGKSKQNDLPNLVI